MVNSIKTSDEIILKMMVSRGNLQFKRSLNHSGTWYTSHSRVLSLAEVKAPVCNQI
jgi:hypothetical protein